MRNGVKRGLPLALLALAGCAQILGLSFLALACDSGPTTTGGAGGTAGGGSGGLGGAGGAGGIAGGSGGGGSGPVLPASLSCVGMVDWGMATLPSVLVDGRLGLFPTGSPLAGATIRACAISDVTCANPLAESTTAADGLYTLDVAVQSQGFDGYLEVTGQNLFPDLIHWLPPPTDDVMLDFTEISTASYDSILTGIGVVRDPTRAHVAVTSLDCGDLAAEGIHVTVDTADASTTIAYQVGNGFDVDATSTAVSGFAIVVNLPVGLATVTLTHEDTGVVIATWDVVTRADHVSSLFLPPSP